jgi:two-component system OmpR family sensor kinase
MSTPPPDRSGSPSTDDLSWVPATVPFAETQPPSGPWEPSGPWAPSGPRAAPARHDGSCAGVEDLEGERPAEAGSAETGSAETGSAETGSAETDSAGAGSAGPGVFEGRGYGGRAAAGRARLLGRFAGVTLRTRLVATILGIMAVFSLVIGVGSVFAMRSYLYSKLDEDVRAATPAAVSGYGRPNSPRILPGQGQGMLAAIVQNGELLDNPRIQVGFADAREVTSVPAEVLASVPADRRGHTRRLGPGVGQYRLLSTPVRNEPNMYVVTGLPTESVTKTVWRMVVIITVAALAGLLAAGMAGAAIVRMTLRPLNRVAGTARKVSTLPLDRGEVALAVRVPEEDTDPRTEVGQVGAALNAMLGHVGAALTARQESETRVRRFVADASHELRTPLAAIRGYAELSRRSAEPVPPDVAHAMARVESQAVRMTGLVEDLLLLASLDSGRPLELGSVDMSMLLVGAVSDAHAAGPDHRWRLDLPDEPVSVVGEAARLTQVVVNLLANARTHTPAGTTVTAGLAVDGPDVVVTVSDDGPGIPPSLLPEVFERFARGDSSRSRAAGSTGLGLSIVAAVIAAHHGTVGVDSVPGRTVFTVRLPLGGPAPT